jgi:MoxR-like ATPase
VAFGVDIDSPALAFQNVDQFENEVEDTVVDFYRMKKGGKGIRSFGGAVADVVIPQAFHDAAPFVELVRRFSLEVVNRFMTLGKTLTEDKLTPSVIARLLQQSSALAQDLLTRLLSGDGDTKWLMPAEMAAQRYGALVTVGAIAVSRAPLKILVKRPDAFTLGSIDDNGRVIVHQSVMDALMKCGPPEKGRELVQLLSDHETKEAAFVGVAAKILANKRPGEVKQKAELHKAMVALRKECNLPLDNESIEQDVDFIMANQRNAYEIFHAYSREKYSPLFVIADGIIRSAIYEGDLKMPYLGVVEEQDGAYLHLFEPGMAAPARLKVNGSTKVDDRLIKLYVKTGSRWERLDPRVHRGVFPSRLGYSLPGGDQIRSFQFTPSNISQLLKMARVYNRPVASASNLLLAGHPGTGKNTLSYMMLALASKPMRMMSMQPRTTQSDLKERTVLVSDTYDINNVKVMIDGKETVISLKDFPTESSKRLASEVVLAAHDGDTVIIDEIDKINFQEEMTALNAFLARTLPYIHPDFRIVAITNDYKEPDESTRSRFTKIDFEYMSKEDELDYIMGTVFRDWPEDADKAAARANMRTVVTLADELRNAARNHTIERFFTTRAVISLAEHYRFKPDDFRYFRTVFEKVFCTDERLVAKDVPGMIDTALGKYTFKINGQEYIAKSKLPGNYDTGMFEYILRSGRVYCTLGKGADRVEVLTRIAPADIEKARRALTTI